jgi:hypothetical protein
MSANIVPFESKGLPAHIKARLGNIDNSSLGRATSSFPVVSIKGKQFSVVKEGDRSIIEDPRTGEPASSIQVAIVRVNPGLSKAYYAGGYVEGVESKPECFSNDGIRPDPNAEEAQAKSCASCPFNAFGSASTGKGKACRDTKRMAIATVDNLEEPMMLRVPATSLKNLAQYGKLLTEKGVDTRFVATRIGFDPHSTHQVLTFKPVGFLDEETVIEIERLQDEESILQITGEQSAPARVQAEAPVARPKPTVVKAAPQVEEDEEDEDEAPAPAPAPKATKPKVVVRQDVDEDEDEAPAPVAKATPKVAPKPTAKPKAVVRQDTGDDDGLSDDIGSFLSGGFDDD